MVTWLSALALLSPPPGAHIGLRPADHAGCPSYRSDEPVIGTYFFYWYNTRTQEHIIDHDGTDALTTHPLRRPGEPYAYDSLDWWRGELADVRAAGIDFIAPVYWGTPEPNPQFAWSYVGLRTLAELIAQRQAAGEPVTPVAMFYDTSTLRVNTTGYHAELDTERGKLWFYETIRNFWSLLPPSAWCRLDGRPVIILYAAAFAKSRDEALFADMKRRFQADFGVEPYLIKHADWPGEADGVITWGGALGLVTNTTAAVGPGYDHTAVPGRQPLIVDREESRFYQEQWHKLLAMNPARRPSLVMVETWNEFHEGTDVAPSVEYGRTYLEWTSWFSALWHAGARRPRVGPFSTAPEVAWTAGRAEDGGLEVRSSGDGLFQPASQAGRAAIATTPNPHGPARYLYFDADWSFAFDESGGRYELEVTFWDSGCRGFGLEYDSRDPGGSVREGAFKACGATLLGGTPDWRTTTFAVDDARLADRANGADFRLVADGGELTVAAVRLRRLP